MSSGTLTISSGITIRGQSGYLGYSPGIGGSPTNVSVVNQGTIQWASGGNIIIVGTLTNDGTITIDSTSTMAPGGTIIGGTITTQPGAGISNGTLNGVTVDGNWQVLGNNSVTIQSGLTLNGILTLGGSSNYGFLTFSGSQTLAGSGTVVFTGTGLYNALGMSSGTLTIGSGITIRGQSGYLGYSPDIGGSPGNVSVVNQGTIQVDVSGGTITIDGNDDQNNGMLTVANGGTLSLSVTNFTNNGVISANTASTITFQSGSFNLNSGTLISTGSFLVQSSTFNFNGGIVSNPIALISSTLNIGSTASQAASFDFYSTGNSLTGNLGVGQALIVETSISYPNSSLTLPNGMNNSGLIGIAPHATVNAGTVFTNNAAASSPAAAR